MTPQRIAVYKYLCENRTHPDADEIYKNVARTNPSFSKTTIYNSLLALEKVLCSLPEPFEVDGQNVYYRGVCPECK